MSEAENQVTVSEHFSKVEAVLFDLDGTLIDTDDMVVENLARQLSPMLGERAELAARWLLMKAEMPGNMLIAVLDRLGLDERLIAITDGLRRKRGVYPAAEFRLIPDVASMVRILSDRYKLAIVTTRSRYHLERFLEQYPDIGEAIQASCGLQDTRRQKPHPRPVQLAAERLGVSVSTCLMVGDTPVDIKAARRAGAWSAGVLCGFGQRGELERAGAHIILDSTADLLKFL